MAPNIGDVLRIICKLSQAANDIQNVFHAKIQSGTAPGGSTLLAAIISALDAAYDNINYGVADNVSYDTIALYNLTQDEYYGEAAWFTLTNGGGGTNPMLPPQNAPLVLFPTTEPGSQGKKFLPPITDNVIDDDGSLTAGFVGNMGVFASDILAGVAPGTYTVDFGVYRPITDEYISFASAIPRDFVATQRRRYTGKGT